MKLPTFLSFLKKPEPTSEAHGLTQLFLESLRKRCPGLILTTEQAELVVEAAKDALLSHLGGVKPEKIKPIKPPKTKVHPHLIGKEPCGDRLYQGHEDGELRYFVETPNGVSRLTSRKIKTARVEAERLLERDVIKQRDLDTTLTALFNDYQTPIAILKHYQLANVPEDDQRTVVRARAYELVRRGILIHNTSGWYPVAQHEKNVYSLELPKMGHGVITFKDVRVEGRLMRAAHPYDGLLLHGEFEGRDITLHFQPNNGDGTLRAIADGIMQACHGLDSDLWDKFPDSPPTANLGEPEVDPNDWWACLLFTSMGGGNLKLAFTKRSAEMTVACVRLVKMPPLDGLSPPAAFSATCALLYDHYHAPALITKTYHLFHRTFPMTVHVGHITDSATLNKRPSGYECLPLPDAAHIRTLVPNETVQD